MTRAYRHALKGAKVNRGSPLGRSITAHFLFNGNFKSCVSGKPAITTSTGPYIATGPMGQYAMGTGAGKIATNLSPSQLGCSGASPRTVIVEFSQGDTNQGKIVFGFGDNSATARTQFTLETANTYRQVRLNTYSSDLAYTPWTGTATTAKVFLAITYDGATSIVFRSWATVYNATTGALVGVQFNTQTNTLPGPLNTGNTSNLDIMGGGPYNFGSMTNALYYLSIYGNRALTPKEIDSIYNDRHRVLATPASFPYPVVASQAPTVTYFSTQGSAVAVSAVNPKAQAISRAYGTSTATSQASSTAISLLHSKGATAGSGAMNSGQSVSLYVATATSTSTSVVSGNAYSIWNVNGSTGGVSTVAAASLGVVETTPKPTSGSVSGTSFASAVSTSFYSAVANAIASSTTDAETVMVSCATGESTGIAGVECVTISVYSADGLSISDSELGAIATSIAHTFGQAEGSSTAEGISSDGVHYTASGDKFTLNIAFAPYKMSVENKPYKIKVK